MMEHEELPQRVAKLETRVEIHDVRLGKHGEEIEALRNHNVRQDTVLEKLSDNQEKNNEMTSDIRGVVKFIKWLVTGVSALIGLYISLKQIGVL